ncbi:MAG TPA: metallopeptidase family protein [Candidatus Eisenbacteria bacterium]|jgi:predicted Zn-dependent protease with MMP-like domain|nr:metallopeptidase family protein [Candidatus Eisenbacteria bacterium]
MERSLFERMVAEEFARIPDNIRKKLENVDFVLEDEASAGQRDSHGMRRGDELLGLYEGVPLSSRRSGYFGVLPDKISLFQGPLERCASADDAELRKMVYDTLLHEIGHHFGFCETDVRSLERKRARRKRAQ